MLYNINANYVELFAAAKTQLPFMGELLAGLWVINLINWFLLGSKLNYFGVIPRHLFGLIGILFSPILHANFNHLFLNTIPLFVLGMFLLALDRQTFIAVTVILAIVQGAALWVVGSRGIHIGASGIISGYFGFIIGLAFYYPNPVTLILAATAIFYFGSILAGILPLKEGVSWEGHLLGLVSGFGLIYCLLYIPSFAVWVTKTF